MPMAKTTKELLQLNPGAGGMTANEKTRTDRKGETIGKHQGQKAQDRKNKLAHKITFADQLGEEPKPKLATTIYVESYKKHNVMGNPTNPGCCTLF